jgi:hypothetical protein
MNVVLQWKPTGRGVVESTGRRFIIKGRSMGGQELIDRRTGKRYSATHAEPLRARASTIVTEEGRL